MRFGRLILLAGLAPLLGLPAVAAMLTAAAAESSSAREQALVAFVAPDAELASINLSTERTSRLAVLDLGVFADTPLAHSVWMVERLTASQLPVRTALRLPLRL